MVDRNTHITQLDRLRHLFRQIPQVHMWRTFFPYQQGNDANTVHYPQQPLERGVRATVINGDDFYTKNYRNEDHVVTDGLHND